MTLRLLTMPPRHRSWSMGDGGNVDKRSAAACFKIVAPCNACARFTGTNIAFLVVSR